MVFAARWYPLPFVWWLLVPADAGWWLKAETVHWLWQNATLVGCIHSFHSYRYWDTSCIYLWLIWFAGSKNGSIWIATPCPWNSAVMRKQYKTPCLYFSCGFVKPRNVACISGELKKGCSSRMGWCTPQIVCGLPFAIHCWSFMFYLVSWWGLQNWVAPHLLVMSSQSTFHMVLLGGNIVTTPHVLGNWSSSNPQDQAPGTFINSKVKE